MRTYTVQIPAVSISTAITVLQITAQTNKCIRLTSIYLWQSTTTTNAQQRIQILRKSAAATVTSATPAPMAAGDAAFGGTAGYNASAEGTDSTVLYNDAFSLLTGFIWRPIPQEFIEVAGAGIIAIKFPVAPAAATTWEGEIVFQEFG